MHQIEKEYWQKYAPRLLEEPPASTLIQPLSLIMPNVLIEIDVIAGDSKVKSIPPPHFQ